MESFTRLVPEGRSTFEATPEAVNRIREFAKVALEEGFGRNADFAFAIVGSSGTVYDFGREVDREEAVEFCAPVDTRDEPLFIFDRLSQDS